MKQSKPAEKGAEQRNELTEREKKVMALVRRGLSNKEIARALGMSEASAKQHVQGIFKKTGFRSRTALMYALSVSEDQ